MSAHTPYQGLASIPGMMPTVLHCNFEHILRSRYPNLRQVTLVGIYAICLHAYDFTGLVEPPSMRGQGLEEALGLILERFRYPTFTIPLHIKIAHLPGPLPRVQTGVYENGLITIEESIGAELPSALRRFVISRGCAPQGFTVAEGVYIALDLIESHYTQMRQHDHLREENEATLALFLHSLILLAPSRGTLNLPCRKDARGRVILSALHHEQVGAIQGHPEFVNWRGTLTDFVNDHGQRQQLVNSASQLYYEFMRWRESLGEAGYEQSAQGFKHYLMDSLEQIRLLLEPLVPDTLPSFTQAQGRFDSNNSQDFHGLRGLNANTLPPIQDQFVPGTRRQSRENLPLSPRHESLYTPF